MIENRHREYNTIRPHSNLNGLHSAIGYITPKDKMEGRDRQIFAERDRKLQEARERRKQRRMQTRAECQRAVAEMVASAK